jgi:putative mRNA 3-end processing factor
MARLTFLGSCREIGRSGFHLQEQGESIVIDYGVKLLDNPVFPGRLPTDDLQGIALTHAHLDHSGGIPLLLAHDVASLFCTPATRDLSMLLLDDMYNLSKAHLPFSAKDIARLQRQCQPTAYEETIPLGRHFEITLFNAGHIPGSAMVSVRCDGKRILFTGDFNSIETQLMPGARKNLPKHDIVVTESTYAQRVNAKREEIEEEFIQTVMETLQRGGTVLIPAFAVGRSQEIMCIFEKYNLPGKYVVYVDGLARKVNEVVVKHPGYIASPQSFDRAVEKTRIIYDDRDRLKAVQKGGVIISPAGMLKGGPSHMYFKMLYDDPRNSIVLVSFQIPGTPGAELLAKRKVTVSGKTFEVAADVRFHHLSSHSDAEGLMDVLEKIPGNPEFYCVHGESDSCDALAEKLSAIGRRAHVPETNEAIEV